MTASLNEQLRNSDFCFFLCSFCIAFFCTASCLLFHRTFFYMFWYFYSFSSFISVYLLCSLSSHSFMCSSVSPLFFSSKSHSSSCALFRPVSQTPCSAIRAGFPGCECVCMSARCVRTCCVRQNDRISYFPRRPHRRALLRHGRTGPYLVLLRVLHCPYRVCTLGVSPRETVQYCVSLTRVLPDFTF